MTNNYVGDGFQLCSL